MEQTLFGIMMYFVAMFTIGGIYAIIVLGLNMHWGVSGLFNAGIAGFFAIGAYTTAILTTPTSPKHLGGFDLPVWLGMLGSMVTAGIVAYGVGRICLRLRADYLAIATIGIAEIFRLVLKNETWMTNGTRGITNVPRPFEDFATPWSQIAFLGVVILVVAATYFIVERALDAPWGRVMRAIRENDTAAEAAGKNVVRFRLQAFVFGAMFMGLGGAMTAHAFKFIGPEATEPLLTTFLVWVMLIIGGSGNNRGAILGAIVVWAIWSMTQLVTGFLPPDWAVRASLLRVFLVGLLLQVMLQNFSGGLIPEKSPKIGDRQKQTPAP